MKKSIFAIISLFIFAASFPIFAGEAKFIRDYFRFYENAEYLNGNYRSNFVSIPQNRMLSYKDGFEWKVGVFEVDGNTLFVGYNDDGSGALQLCDENGKLWISKDSYREREESYFKYQGGGSGGVITQIELKGKKYTVAIAGISSNKAGIYSDVDGFRMWVETEAPKDTATSKTIDKALCYEDADIREGVYKPGWTRLWGEVVERPENAGFIYKYSYNGSDFIFNGNSDDGSEWLRDTDGNLLPMKIVSSFNMYNTESNGKTSGRIGLGLEADVQLGNKKVRIVISQCNGDKRVWVKDTSGYPVISSLQNSNKTNSKAKAKKNDTSKKSGKLAGFTRDYEKYRRIYSTEDISKGIYKTNYKNIAQKGSEDVSFKVTMKEKGEVTLSCKAGIFNIDDYQISIFYNPEMGWQIMPKSSDLQFSYRTKNRFDLSSEKIRIGMQAELEVSINEKKYELAFFVLNAGNGDYRVFEKTGPNEETALSEKDIFGIEYYDAVDLRSGVYKPGFESLTQYRVRDEAQKALFENVTDDDPVSIFDYKGKFFLIGPAQDPANYVKNIDGSVIYNPELQIRCRTLDNEGNFRSYQGLTYGWEGKVRLGDKELTLAYVKWGPTVFAFVKE